MIKGKKKIPLLTAIQTNMIGVSCHQGAKCGSSKCIDIWTYTTMLWVQLKIREKLPYYLGKKRNTGEQESGSHPAVNT